MELNIDKIKNSKPEQKSGERVKEIRQKIKEDRETNKKMWAISAFLAFSVSIILAIMIFK